MQHSERNKASKINNNISIRTTADGVLTLAAAVAVSLTN